MTQQNTTTTTSHPIEMILRRGLRLLLGSGLILVVVVLVYPAPAPGDGLLAYTIVHLSVVQIIAVVFAIRVTPLLDRPWSALRRPWLASAATLVAAVVGFSALLTLATSAAARYDPSLQFLQLLSSLDIAWVVATLYLAARSLWGMIPALAASSMLLAACVVSIAVYLGVVGFTDGGGWLVDGAEMMRIVIPSDIVAALLALGALLSAARVQPTAQASPHS